MSRTSKIPVSVITGFLGAGKTTFINKVLNRYKNTKFALVENEFGDVAIDTKLIKGLDASQMFELKQGCICCTISDEYELVLQELAEQFPTIEHLIIETTGVADPASVIQPFFRDENLKEIYKYNGTICLVDALNFEFHPEKELANKQIVIADQILVSKSENLSAEQNAFLLDEIKKINPIAEIDFTGFGTASNVQLDSIQIIKRHSFDFFRLQTTHATIQTKTLSFVNPLNKEDFTNWLSYTLDVYKNQIYRTKGILCFENEPYQFILQGVGGSFELEEGEMGFDQTKSEIVFIGKLFEVNLAF